MSRIRSVHPGLWTDDDFVAMSLPARLFLIGMWNEADDYGIFEWKPLRLKMRLAPADNFDASALMDELVEHGFLVRLVRASKEYGAVKNFRKFQRPQKPGKPLVALDDEIRAIIHLVTTEADGDGGDSPPRLFRDHYSSVQGNPPQMEDGGGKGKVIDFLPPRSTLPSDSRPESDQGREGGGDVSRCFQELVSVYPKGDHPQVRVERAIAALPEADWPRLIAGARSYAFSYEAKPTTHPHGLERFIRERLFLNHEPKSTGPPTVFIEVDTPEWDARVSAGHKPSLRTRGKVGKRIVEGWHFPQATRTA